MKVKLQYHKSISKLDQIFWSQIFLNKHLNEEKIKTTNATKNLASRNKMKSFFFN
jgi:hypothetical protein